MQHGPDGDTRCVDVDIDPIAVRCGIVASLLSFQQTLSLPLFLVFFGGILFGLLIGFFCEWLREHKHRAAASERKAEVRKLERELKKTQAERDKDKDEVLAILDQSA